MTRGRLRRMRSTAGAHLAVAAVDAAVRPARGSRARRAEHAGRVARPRPAAVPACRSTRARRASDRKDRHGGLQRRDGRSSRPRPISRSSACGPKTSTSTVKVNLGRESQERSVSFACGSAPDAVSGTACHTDVDERRVRGANGPAPAAGDTSVNDNLMRMLVSRKDSEVARTTRVDDGARDPCRRRDIRRSWRADTWRRGREPGRETSGSTSTSAMAVPAFASRMVRPDHHAKSFIVAGP